METNILAISPSYPSEFFTDYVLVKAALFVRETEGKQELVLRIMAVREDEFMEVVPMSRHGHPETFGGTMIELTSNKEFYGMKRFFSGFYSTDNHRISSNSMDGKFITVLREGEGFHRGKKLSVAAVYAAKKNLATAERIINALHQSITKMNQCKEIASEYDKLPLKWRSIIDFVTSSK